MKNIFNATDINIDAKDNIEGLKKDLMSLLQRFSSLKNNAYDIIPGQISKFFSTFSNIKNKGLDTSFPGNFSKKKCSMMTKMLGSACKNSTRNLLVSFGIFAAVIYLMKK